MNASHDFLIIYHNTIGKVCNLIFVCLTSKSASSNFIYNLLTPNDFPIDAKKMIASKNIKKGIKNKEIAKHIIIHSGAILLTTDWEIQEI